MTPRERVARAYDTHYELLRFAAQRCGIPPSDIQALIHDVFVAFMRHSQAVADDRAWLLTAVRNACRNYWRDRKEHQPASDVLVDFRKFDDDVSARVDIARVLAHVTERCRRILLLRYVEGLTPEEIAARCSGSRSTLYGRQMVHRCLRAAREALAGMKEGCE